MGRGQREGELEKELEGVEVTYRDEFGNRKNEDRHRRRLPYGNGGDCRKRKTPRRAPLYDELDPATFFSLFHCENQQKLLPPKLHLLTPICTKSFVGWGACSAPPDL